MVFDRKENPRYSINSSEFLYGFRRSHKVHSNGGDGFKLYLNGSFPNKRVVFEDMLSYHNTGDGVIFHNSKKLKIDGGMFADNRRKIKVNKQSDNVTVTNDTILIGFSRLYQLKVERRVTASPIILLGGHSLVYSCTPFFVTVTPRETSSRTSPSRISVLKSGWTSSLEMDILTRYQVFTTSNFLRA